MVQSLNGNWRLRERGSERDIEAVVPGCNYLDLLRNNLIPDPFEGMNEEKVFWVAQKDWEYERVFSLTPEECAYPVIFLSCDMLDTICDVYINEELVGSAENCHHRHRFDIKDRVRPGENRVRVLFHSPVEYIKAKNAAERCPINANGLNGIPHIRKPQCHFGWDWGPILPPSGISGNIGLEFIEGADIENLRIEQDHADGRVRLRVECETVRYDAEPTQCTLTVKTPDGKTLTASGYDAEFIIEKPCLWWTADLAEQKPQPLYTVCATLSRGGRELDTVSKRVGLRTIALNREKDKYGTNFQFILNGVPLFVKGANWIPADTFINRFDEEKLEYLLDAAVFSNMNMLRVWGGGYYESDAFYDLCDEKGLLVWQDFAFACQPYPFFDEAFLNNVMREVAEVVNRLRHHASLAVWCGNNEIEALSLAWRSMRKFVRWTDEFFYRILEPAVREHDTVTAYSPGSPCGISHLNGHDKDNVGDTHLWAVWHGLQPMNYYRKRLTRFCSEFGFESLPDIKTIEKYAKPEDYSLTSEVFKAHQKCPSGNMKMVYYIASRFALPKRFEDFVYLSQIAQQECVSDATEHWRRNKGRCNGAMYWQLNDCWPVCSWASVDYYGNYKALQYTARHVNAPLSISLEDSEDAVRVVVLNDFNRAQEVTAVYKLFDFERGVIEEQAVSGRIGALANKEIFRFDLRKLAKRMDFGSTGLATELYRGKELVSRKTVLFRKEKDLTLPPVKPTLSYNEIGDTLRLTVTADRFARLVRLESPDCAQPFSDNYFDLLPGERKTVTIARNPSLTAEQQASRITVFSCFDTEPDGKPIKTALLRKKILLEPVNLGGWLYHRRIPKDAKTD